jgi:Domain of unknown function (DUF3303)
MKFVIVWEMPHKPMSDQALAEAYEVFRRKPERKELNFLQIVARVDNHGGFAVVETDDPLALSKEAQLYQPFFEYYIYPVIDLEQFAPANAETVEFLNSIRASFSSGGATSGKSSGKSSTKSSGKY